MERGLELTDILNEKVPVTVAFRIIKEENASVPVCLLSFSYKGERYLATKAPQIYLPTGAGWYKLGYAFLFLAKVRKGFLSFPKWACIEVRKDKEGVIGKLYYLGRDKRRAMEVFRKMLRTPRFTKRTEYVIGIYLYYKIFNTESLRILFTILKKLL